MEGVEEGEGATDLSTVAWRWFGILLAWRREGSGAHFVLTIGFLACVGPLSVLSDCEKFAGQTWLG